MEPTKEDQAHALAGAVFGMIIDQISTVKMLEAINAEIDLCKRPGKTELAAMFQIEKIEE